MHLGRPSKTGGFGDSRVVVPRSHGRIAGGSKRTGRASSAKTKRQTEESPIEQKKVNFFVESVADRYIIASKYPSPVLSERERGRNESAQ